MAEDKVWIITNDNMEIVDVYINNNRQKQKCKQELMKQNSRKKKVDSTHFLI